MQLCNYVWWFCAYSQWQCVALCSISHELQVVGIGNVVASIKSITVYDDNIGQLWSVLPLIVFQLTVSITGCNITDVNGQRHHSQ